VAKEELENVEFVAGLQTSSCMWASMFTNAAITLPCRVAMAVQSAWRLRLRGVWSEIPQQSTRSHDLLPTSLGKRVPPGRTLQEPGLGLFRVFRGQLWNRSFENSFLPALDPLDATGTQLGVTTVEGTSGLRG